jgi:hypothetical protein
MITYHRFKLNLSVIGQFGLNVVLHLKVLKYGSILNIHIV